MLICRCTKRFACVVWLAANDAVTLLHPFACRFLVTADHGNSDDMVQREKKTNKPLLDKDSGGDLGQLLVL